MEHIGFEAEDPDVLRAQERDRKRDVTGSLRASPAASTVSATTLTTMFAR